MVEMKSTHGSISDIEIQRGEGEVFLPHPFLLIIIACGDATSDIWWEFMASAIIFIIEIFEQKYGEFDRIVSAVFI